MVSSADMAGTASAMAGAAAAGVTQALASVSGFSVSQPYEGYAGRCRLVRQFDEDGVYIGRVRVCRPAYID